MNIEKYFTEIFAEKTYKRSENFSDYKFNTMWM